MVAQLPTISKPHLYKSKFLVTVYNFVKKDNLPLVSGLPELTDLLEDAVVVGGAAKSGFSCIIA